MKVNKYIIGMFVATATFFVSCNTDNEGDIYNSTTMGVTFATGTQSVSFPSTGHEGFDLPRFHSQQGNLRPIFMLQLEI